MKRKKKAMSEISKGFEKFIKGKASNKNNGQLFEKAIKKAVKADSK